MNKVYLTLVASILAFCTSSAASNLDIKSSRELDPKNQLIRKTPETNRTSIKKGLNITNAPITGMRKADAQASIEGYWTFTMGDYYFNSSMGPFDYVYQATLDGNKIKFEDPWSYEPPFYGTYDAEKAIITFSTEYLGTKEAASGKLYYVYQEPYVYNFDTNSFDVQDIVGVYNAQKGTLSFEADNGISWPAYLDIDKTSDDLYFWIYDLEGATNAAGGTVDSKDWTDLGNATFMDGWVLPLYDIDQTDEANWFKVPLQQNNINKNLYRLVDPYHQAGFPALAYNESKTVGYIEFDITDNDHVLVNPNKVEAGFANSEEGIYNFYCYNSLQFYLNKYTMSADALISLFGDAIPFTSFKDGVVELGYIEFDGEIDYDANFGRQGGKNGGYMWQTSTGDLANMSTKIIFPTEDDGISDVINDNNATPLYYNLQGIQIAKPMNGIFIRVQGNKATKVIVK